MMNPIQINELTRGIPPSIWRLRPSSAWVFWEKLPGTARLERSKWEGRERIDALRDRLDLC